MRRRTRSSPKPAPSDKLAIAVYKDALSPAAKEVGRSLAGVVRVALSPANFAVWSFDRALEYAANRVGHVLERRHVPTDRVIQPPVELTASIVTQLRLQDQAQGLRDLYINLLATAMNRETARDAHPSFVEIIRQLTPDEGRVINLFTGVEATGSPRDFPLLNVVSHLREGGFEQVLARFTLLGTQAGCVAELPTSSIDNLSRLGLIAIRHDQRVASAAAYEPLERHPTVRDAMELAASRPGARAEIQHGLVEVTDFGFRFALACTGDISCIGLNPRDESRGSA